MKYIKEYNDIFKNTDYFISSTYDEFYKDLTNHGVLIDSNIREHLPFINYGIDYMKLPGYNGPDSWILRNKIITYLYTTTESGRISIYSLDDEWFYVYVYNTSIYKCDQIEGLLKFLKYKSFLWINH